MVPTWCKSIINVDCSEVISLPPMAQKILSFVIYGGQQYISKLISRILLLLVNIKENGYKSPTYRSNPLSRHLLEQNFQCGQEKQLMLPAYFKMLLVIKKIQT